MRPTPARITGVVTPHCLQGTALPAPRLAGRAAVYRLGARITLGRAPTTSDPGYGDIETAGMATAALNETLGI